MSAQKSPIQADHPDVIVVGGGAAGILASLAARARGASVLLLEKNDRIGMKILISGGGKCNLTHAGTMESIRAQFRHNEALFLKPSFYKFTNTDFLSLLHAQGMQTYTRDDGRIFPVDPANAKDVVTVLAEQLRQSGTVVRFGTPVEGLVVTDGKCTGVHTRAGLMSAQCVVVCAGGSSYPSTGTTGDAWRWLPQAGHTITPLRAALAPLYLEDPRAAWSGIALRNVVLRARRSVGGKELKRWQGDILYSHKGLTGPAALAVSREVAELLADAPAAKPALEADLAPDRDFEAVLNGLKVEARNAPRKQLVHLLAGLLPQRILDTPGALGGFAQEKRMSEASAQDFKLCTRLIKEWPVGIVRTVPLERGEVVAGGVSLPEVNAQTMESRIVPDLFLCGEVLDVAGPVGGYNLQAAWSTGWVAGTSAAAKAAALVPTF